MKIRFCLLVLFFLFGLTIYSQQSNSSVQIKGVIHDSLTNQPIEWAVIALYKLQDSLLVKSVATDSKGAFEFKNILPDNYYLTASFVGYSNRSVKIEKSLFNTSTVDLANLFLYESGIELNQVEIIAELPELVVKQDTLEYNAAAFNMQESAVVEDLLKRLPGVEVDVEGKISTPSGKQIQRVFVNGKAFFGKDPKMATKNLTVDMVDKVQVVEKKSDLSILTGVEDDDPETIINIVIKKGMKKGWMGNVVGGGGDFVDNNLDKDLRYLGNAVVNRFQEDDQYSFVANANNLNNQGYTDEGNTTRTSQRRRDNQSGITASNAIGANFANSLNKKWKATGSFSYNNSDNYDKTNSFRQNLSEKQPSYLKKWEIDQNYNKNFNIEGKVEYHPDSLTTIILTPSFSFNSSSTEGVSEQKTQKSITDESLLNDIKAHDSFDSEGKNSRMQLDISRKLSKKGRRISLSGSMNINNSDGDGLSKTHEIYYNSPSRNKDLNQQLFNIGNRNTYNLRATYVEPIGRKGNFLNFSYNIQWNNTETVKDTYDFNESTHEFDLFNSKYSRSSKSNNISQNFRANYNSVRERYTYNIGINVIPTYIESINETKGETLSGVGTIGTLTNSRNVVNYSPQLNFTYRFNRSKMVRENIKITYAGRTQQPSVSQLDPTPNITNPLNIRSGNPDLLPSFRHNLSIDYSKNHREKGQSLTISASHTFTQNEFVNFTSYDDSTSVRTSYPINENGSWQSRLNILFSRPLDSKKKLRFSTQTMGVLNNQIGYLKVANNSSSSKNISLTSTLSETVGLSYSNNWFYGQLRGMMRYSQTNYSLHNIARQESYYYRLTYNTQIKLPKNWSVASDINYATQTGLSAGYNRDEVIWNMEIGKQLFKNKQGTLRLQVTDLLQQRLAISRNVTPTYIQDTESLALTSYVLCSFAYRFNSMGGKGSGGRRRNTNPTL